MVISQYKQNGEISIAINDRDIWKSAGSYSYQLNETFELVRTFDFCAQDEGSFTVDSPIPVLAVISNSDTTNVTIFQNNEELFNAILSGTIVKMYYYGAIGSIDECKWKLENDGNMAVCRIAARDNKWTMMVFAVEIDVESEKEETIIVNQGISYKTVELPCELNGSDIVLNKKINSGEEFESEKRKLGTVIFAIKGKISEIEAKPSYVDRYATITGGDDGTEFAQLQHNKKVSQKDYEKIDWLNERANIPYKYRVDCKRNGIVHKYYLGPASVSESDLGRGNAIISYFSEEGKRLATYNPNDKKTNSEISLRREFNISKSILHDYKNIVGTVTAESSEFREGLYDPFLIDIFKKRRESREIKDIVISIQDNQNSIVDVPGNESVVVQGCAGSGKTMVMMHRMSKLLNWDKAFDAREAVIIGPSKQYKSFMRNVVEGLAITTIMQTTIEDYYNELISEISKDFAAKSNFRSETAVNEELLEYIYSSDFLAGMDLCIADASKRQEEFCADVYNFLEEIGEKGTYELRVPINQFYDKVSDAIREIKAKKNEEKNQIEKLKERISFLQERKQELENGAIDSAKEVYEAFVNDTVDRVRDRVKNADDEVLRGISDHGVGDSLDSKLLFLFKVARVDPETEKELVACERKEGEIQELEKELREKPRIIEADQKRLQVLLKNSDFETFEKSIRAITEKAESFKCTKLYTSIFDELVHKVLVEQNIKRPRGIHRYDLYSRLQFCIRFYKRLPSLHKYMFIDEGQDFSYMEYKLLGILGGHKVVFNIFGDLNQVTNHGHGMNDWRSLKELFSFKMFYLEENYRNSNQITRYCNEKFSLSMREIGINAAQVKEITKDEFEYEIVTDIKPKDDRWIILLDRSMDKKKFIKSVPTNKLSSDQIGNDDIAVMYVDEIKGFEFDRVYVITPNMNTNTKYVAYTRALNELLVVNW